MNSLRRLRWRVALVGTLTVLAAAAGVWAQQQGTEVTLTKTGQEYMRVDGTETTGTAPSVVSEVGGATGWDDTSQEPPAPETNISGAEGYGERRSTTGESCTVWASGAMVEDDVVRLGPGAATGSINATVPG